MDTIELQPGKGCKKVYPSIHYSTRFSGTRFSLLGIKRYKVDHFNICALAGMRITGISLNCLAVINPKIYNVTQAIP